MDENIFHITTSKFARLVKDLGGLVLVEFEKLFWLEWNTILQISFTSSRPMVVERSRALTLDRGCG